MTTHDPAQSLRLLPYVPFDPKVTSYDFYAGRGLVPTEYSDWRAEFLSWKTSVGLHAHLNPTFTITLRGPDTLRFLSDVCVNSFKSFPVGAGKHAILCNDRGNVMMHGMVLRTADEEVVTQWLAPWLTYLLDRYRGKYDVKAEDQTMSTFLFQVAGPDSLSTLEAASGDNLHDIRFIRHRPTRINDKTVRIVRVGMAGTLAYEVHGQINDAIPVYEAILRAGRQFGIRRLGFRAYMLSHTEGGFPQFGYHFAVAWDQDRDFTHYLERLGIPQFTAVEMRGSAGPDLTKRYRNPIELGWGHVVKFDHPFIGREALERLVAAPQRKMVSLEWDKEDIVDVHRSQLETGEPYLPMDLPNQMGIWPGRKQDDWYSNWADDVRDAEGKIVGISSGRAYSPLFHQVISLASIDVAQAIDGNELRLMWGDPGTRQKEIRVRVARFPYLAQNRNEHVDVSTIPAVATAR